MKHSNNYVMGISILFEKSTELNEFYFILYMFILSFLCGIYLRGRN